MCENCGAIGVKHSFYTKLRNYCSQACVKTAMEKSDVIVNEPQKNNVCDKTESSSTSINNEQIFSELVCFWICNSFICV